MTLLGNKPKNYTKMQSMCRYVKCLSIKENNNVLSIHKYKTKIKQLFVVKRMDHQPVKLTLRSSLGEKHILRNAFKHFCSGALTITHFGCEMRMLFTLKNVLFSFGKNSENLRKTYLMLMIYVHLLLTYIYLN